MKKLNQHNKIPMIVLLIGILISFQILAYEPDDGQIAPDFEIIQSDGSTFKLSDYKGKKSVYVIFWNTWCPYCMKKTSKLLATQKNLADDIMVIAINTSRKDSIEEMQKFKDRFNTTYAMAFDNNETITNLYNVHGVPTEFIIDINGMIKHRDGLPDKFESYMTQWNTKITSISVTVKDYFQQMVSFFNRAHHAS